MNRAAKRSVRYHLHGVVRQLQRAMEDAGETHVSEKINRLIDEIETLRADLRSDER